MQPLLLDKAAEELRLEIFPNAGDDYVRKAGSAVGCTRDAAIVCPDRGPGALETKVVFDFRVWMNRWGGGIPPRDYEMQLQAQMYVGDGERPYEWGVIAAFVCGEMHYFERKPDRKLWDKMEKSAQAFLDDVAAGKEPDPFGQPVEDPYIVELWPATQERKRQDIDDPELAEDARMYAYATSEKSRWDKVAKGLRSKLLGVAEDNEITHLPGATVYVTKNPRAPRIVPFSHELSVALLAGMNEAGEAMRGDVVAACRRVINDGGLVAAKGGVTTTLKVVDNDDGVDPFAI